MVFNIEKDQYDLPVYSQVMDGYEKLYKDMEDGTIISAYAVEGHGLAEAVGKMAFGNKLGVKIEHNVDPRDFFAPGWGNIVCEVPDGKVGELSITYTVIGEVTGTGSAGVRECEHPAGRGPVRLEQTAGGRVPHRDRRGEEIPGYPGSTAPTRSTSARIKWRSLTCSFPYSPATTVSTTARWPSSARAPR